MKEGKIRLSNREKKHRFLALQEPFPEGALPAPWDGEKRSFLKEGHAFLCRRDFEDASLRIGLLIFLFALFSAGETCGEGRFCVISSQSAVLDYASRPLWPGFSRAVGFYRREGLEIVLLPDGRLGCVFEKRAFWGIFHFAKRLSGEKEALFVFLRADFSVFSGSSPLPPRFTAGFCEENRRLFSLLCTDLSAAGYTVSVCGEGLLGTVCRFSLGRRRVTAFCCGQDGFFLSFSLNRAQTALAYRNLSALSAQTASLFLHERDCACPLCREMLRQTVYRFRVWNAPYSTRRLCLKISSPEILSDALFLICPSRLS